MRLLLGVTVACLISFSIVADGVLAVDSIGRPTAMTDNFDVSNQLPSENLVGSGVVSNINNAYIVSSGNGSSGGPVGEDGGFGGGFGNTNSSGVVGDIFINDNLVTENLVGNDNLGNLI